MLKTKLFYQWMPNKTIELINTAKISLINKVNPVGLIYSIQIISSKPLDILTEKQNQKF